MPRVAQVNGVAINVYFNDHNPPHFHVVEGKEKALIAIRDLSVIRGSIPSVRAVIRWAEANGPTLIAAWNECNAENPY